MAVAIVYYFDAYDEFIDLFFVHDRCARHLLRQQQNKGAFRFGDFLADVTCVFGKDSIYKAIAKHYPDELPLEIYRNMREDGCIFCEQNAFD